MNVKRAILAEMLDPGHPVMLQVDGRVCDVPANLRTAELALCIGHVMAPPMEIALADDYLHTTASFGGESYRCRIPWAAITFVQVIDHPETLTAWPNSIPKAGVEPAAPPPAPRGHLRSV